MGDLLLQLFRDRCVVGLILLVAVGVFSAGNWQIIDWLF